jgi:hypothetical protein
MILNGVWKCRNGLFVKVTDTVEVNQFDKKIPYNSEDALTMVDAPEWDLKERISPESKLYNKAMGVLSE